MAEVEGAGDVGQEGPRPSFSMRMTIYGISKKFPSVKSINCQQLDQWRKDKEKKLVCLVKFILYTVNSNRAIVYINTK